MAAKKQKELWKSKTFWFGLIVVLNGVAGVFGFASYEPGPEVQDLVEVLTGFLVIGLRYVTDRPVTLK